MSLLPKVPTDLQGKNKDYLIELVRQLEGELRRRPTTQEGQLIIASSRPLTYYDDAGVAYHMGEDVFPPGLGTSDLDTNGGEVVTVGGDPVLRDSSLDANGGSIPEVDRANAFVAGQTQGGEDMLDEGTSGVVIQHAFANTGALNSTTSIIPYDDTIPQITEGAEALSVSFTPKRADSRIRLRAVLQMRGSGKGLVRTVAIFRAGVSNALAVGASHVPEEADGSTLATALDGVETVSDIASPGTATQTFSVRFGPHASGTMYLNGDSGGTRKYGGAYASTLEIMEYMP